MSQRTIAEQWESYAQAVRVEDFTERQQQALRRSFYAGAFTRLEDLSAIEDGETLAELADRIKAVRDEIVIFFATYGRPGS